MGKTLYLECYSGISGDMTVGALLDLGAREEALREALGALPLKGYEITIGRTKKCGIDACDFDVILEEEEGQEPLHHHGGEAHTHDHEHGSGNHSHGRHSLTAHCHGDAPIRMTITCITSTVMEKNSTIIPTPTVRKLTTIIMTTSTVTTPTSCTCWTRLP